MKKLLLIIMYQLSGLTVFGQLDPDFIDAKKKVDDCFKKGDYSCAKENYQTALTIKENDDYCKKQIAEVVIRLKNEATEREELRKKKEAQKRNEQANYPYFGTLTGLVDSYGSKFSYTGNIAYKVPDGYGKSRFEDGSIYEGGYIMGNRSGKGTYIYASGNRYEGPWKDDKRNGQGTYFWVSGDKFEGTYKDGERNGQGTHFHVSGDKYVGEFKDDKRNGQGTYFFFDGDKYVGEFKDGKFNGQATYFSVYGHVYVGEYKDNHRDGQGTYHWPVGYKYVGEWKDSKMNGQGVYYGDIVNCPNCKTYEGSWINNSKSGFGKCYNSIGKLIYEGNFENDMPTQKYPNRE